MYIIQRRNFKRKNSAKQKSICTPYLLCPKTKRECRKFQYTDDQLEIISISQCFKWVKTVARNARKTNRRQKPRNISIQRNSLETSHRKQVIKVVKIIKKQKKEKVANKKSQKEKVAKKKPKYLKPISLTVGEYSTEHNFDLACDHLNVYICRDLGD